jgi:hypothetical protein
MHRDNAELNFFFISHSQTKTTARMFLFLFMFGCSNQEFKPVSRQLPIGLTKWYVNIQWIRLPILSVPRRKNHLPQLFPQQPQPFNQPPHPRYEKQPPHRRPPYNQPKCHRYPTMPHHPT